MYSIVYSTFVPKISFAISFNVYPLNPKAAFVGIPFLSIFVKVPSCWFSAGSYKSAFPKAYNSKSAFMLYPTLNPSVSNDNVQICETPKVLV